ncbi:ALQxL family class IV lanthipeptide [Streptomyces griseorubiginosus]
MEFDIEALQELVSLEERAVGACAWTCNGTRPTCEASACPATCGFSGS